MTSQKYAKRAPSRGFSLVELIVVITIIALIIAIVVPALGAARRTAKVADTRNLLANLSQSSSVYEQDNKRLPGYYTQNEMGSTDNATRGFSEAQNVMLDLAGGIDTLGIDVGPMTDTTKHVKIDPLKIGVRQGSANIYFSPSAKFFKKQNGNNTGLRFGDPNHALIPDLVDSFGTPILIWEKDEAAPSAPASVAPGAGNTVSFVRTASSLSSSNTPPAWFYWNTNIAFLNAGTFVGEKRIDQGARSFVGSTGVGGPLESLGALLGNPGSPQDVTQDVDKIVPNSARGKMIFQSAGMDAIYMGIADKGNQYSTTNKGVYYGTNFKTLPAPGNPIMSDGKPSSIDVMSSFDDLMLSTD